MSKNRIKKAGVVAAIAAPHAPQFLSMPDTEDKDQVARVRAQLEEIGKVFSKKEIDIVIVISNDHGDHFVTHSVPSFCVHVGNTADGMHKHRGDWKLDSELAYELIPEMGELGFDLAFTLNAQIPTAFTIPYEFLGFGKEDPMLPIFVNAYVPPQPSAFRCYEFGRALERALCKLGKRALLLASGGFSHYPGTEKYTQPDVETDKALFDRIRSGELQFLASLSEREMDRSGNVELRATQILAGVLGEDRVPFVAQFEPSWHHTYVTFAWDLEAENPLVDDYQLSYPRLSADNADLVEALFQIRTQPEKAKLYLENPDLFCQSFRLDSDSKKALVELNEKALRDELGMHPLLVAGAIRHVEIIKSKV